MEVVPPPMSMRVTPNCFSSSTRQESAEAKGETTCASTPRWQRWMQVIRLRVTLPAAVTTCMLTPRRPPNMPRGSRTPRLPSML